ncbi:DUF4396 domain-containing protein [Nocardioides ginkgobilobae]
MDHSTHAHEGHTAHAQDHSGHAGHSGHDMASNRMAVSATLHCLTGCAIGEVLGLTIGTALGLSTIATIALAVSLAFLFGYSTLPLLRAGLGVGAALSVVLAADTLSIATMEVVDNAVMAVVPGAMEAGLVNPVFWLSMPLALTIAFFAALPVNTWLLSRGKGHALTHEFHGAAVTRPWIPALQTPVLVAAIAAFFVGGLVVSVVDELGAGESGSHASALR